ncbi:MAG TPA: SWIM zinc finger family protein [Chloroflexota bacterium]|jgi:predicted nucleic acid-binding Zn finger protein
MSHDDNSTICLNPREQRGRKLAATAKITRDGNRWRVPSQSRRGTYIVSQAGEQFYCSCPDYELRRQTCKHIFAVQVTIEQEVTRTETVTR